MTEEQYFKVFPFAWVCKERGQEKEICHRILMYTFSKTRPKPVTNPNMVWLKPFFGELVNINEAMMHSARKETYKNRITFE